MHRTNGAGEGYEPSLCLHVAGSEYAHRRLQLQDVPPGKWVRPLGSDIEAGATVLAAGERVGAAEIGILATVGAAHVQVYPR